MKWKTEKERQRQRRSTVEKRLEIEKRTEWPMHQKSNLEFELSDSYVFFSLFLVHPIFSLAESTLGIFLQNFCFSFTQQQINEIEIH